MVKRVVDFPTPSATGCETTRKENCAAWTWLGEIAVK